MSVMHLFRPARSKTKRDNFRLLSCNSANSSAHNGLESIKPLLCPEGLAQIDLVTCAPYTPEQYQNDVLAVTEGLADRAQLKVLTEDSYETMKWLKSHGCNFDITLGKVRLN